MLCVIRCQCAPPGGRHGAALKSKQKWCLTTRGQIDSSVKKKQHHNPAPAIPQIHKTDLLKVVSGH